MQLSVSFLFLCGSFLHPFLLFLHDPVLLSAPVLSLFAQCQVSSGDSRQNALPLPAQSLLNFSPQYLLLPSQLLFPGGLSVRCGVVLPVLPAPAPSAFWSAPGIPSAGSGSPSEIPVLRGNVPVLLFDSFLLPVSPLHPAAPV